MKPVLILCVGLALGAGAIYGVLTAFRPPPPSLPPVPSNWTDPAMIELLDAKRHAVETDPTNGTAWGELGMTYDAHEQTAEAVECYRAARQFTPEDPRWIYLLARTQLETDTNSAIELLQACLALPQPTPGHQAAAELTLAQWLADQNRQAEADAIIERVYAADRTNAAAAYRIGVRKLNTNDPTGVAILVRLARNPSAQQKAAAALAAYHRRIGQTDEATGFEYAASLLPADFAFANPYEAEMNRYQRGQHKLIEELNRYEQAGNNAAAVEVARKLADLYPSPRTQLLLGRALVGLTDYDSAVPVLTDAVNAEPGLVMAQAFLGIARFGQAERAEAERRAGATQFYRQAVAALDQAVAAKTDYAPGYYYRARAFVKLGRPADALAAIQECIARRPEEWEGYVVLAEIHEAAGRKAEAVAALEQAVKLAHPAEPRPRQALEKLKAAG